MRLSIDLGWPLGRKAVRRSPSVDRSFYVGLVFAVPLAAALWAVIAVIIWLST